MRHPFSAAAAAALSLFAGSALAAPPNLPVATFDGGAGAGQTALNPSTNLPGQHQNFSGAIAGTAGVNLAPIDGAASAGAQTTIHQFVAANANAAGSVLDKNLFSAGSYADATYHFAVYGPDNIDVTVVLQGRVEANVAIFGAATSVYAQTRFDVYGNDTFVSGPQVVSMYCELDDAYGQCGSRDFTTVLTIKAFTSDLIGEVGTIDLAVSAGAQGRSLGFSAPYDTNGGFARATADPVFSIDPTFVLDHPGYSIVFSDGVSNGVLPTSNGAAPEPATWALMMLAVGGMGASLRTRRRKVAV